jgi:hypothetical protein
LVDSELRWYGKILSKDFKEIKIVILSDLHYGNPYCSVKHFIRTVNFIKEHDDCFCFLNGDLCESAIKTSKGDIFKQVGSPQDQRDWVIKQLLPIKDKVMACTIGNHENRIANEIGMDISADIAKALGCPYKAEGILFKLSFGGGNEHHPEKPYVFWSYITHGYGGARTKSAKAVKVERISSWVHADLYAMSHDHVVNASPNVYLMPDNRGTIDKDTGFLSGKVVDHREELVKTNAYLKWGGYAELGGFSPSDLTTPLILFLTPQSPSWKDLPDKPRQAVRVIV